MEKTWFGNLKYNGNLTVSTIVYLQQGTTNNKLTKFFLVLSDARISCSAVLKSSIVGTCGKSGASLKSWHIFWMVSSILAKLIQHFSLKPFKNRKSDKQICLITTNQWLSSIFNQFSHLIQIVQDKMNKKKTSSDFRMTDIKFIYVNWNIL